MAELLARHGERAEVGVQHPNACVPLEPAPQTLRELWVPLDGEDPRATAGHS
jgi:hypothetical protein